MLRGRWLKETLRVVPQTTGGYASTRRHAKFWSTTCPPGTCSPPTRASRFWIRKTSGAENVRARAVLAKGDERENAWEARNARFLTRASDPDAYFPGGVSASAPACPSPTLMTQIFLVYATARVKTDGRRARDPTARSTRSTSNPHRDHRRQVPPEPGEELAVRVNASVLYVVWCVCRA